MKTIWGVFAGLLLATSSPLFATGIPSSVKYVTSCGTIITQPGEYHLKTDLTCPTLPGYSGYAITINSSYVNLYFDGHTLSGKIPANSPSGTANGSIGVLVNGVTNVGIYGNGIVDSFEGAIIVTNCTLVEINCMTAINSVGSTFGAGIIIENANCNKIVNCITNNNSLLGVELLGHPVAGSTGNQGCMNTTYSPTCKLPSDKPSLKIRLCYLTNRYDNPGQADNNYVSGNTANGNKVAFLLQGADKNTLINNEAFSNGFGFFVNVGSTANYFTLNEAGKSSPNFDAEDDNKLFANFWLFNKFGTTLGSGVR